MRLMHFQKKAGGVFTYSFFCFLFFGRYFGYGLFGGSLNRFQHQFYSQIETSQTDY
jgi:hypothetical protein